jgi:hypothetical protein
MPDFGLSRDDRCPRKANAVMFMLSERGFLRYMIGLRIFIARNVDLPYVISSMKQLEDRFNGKFGYPYVFLNDEPFSDEFRT